LQAPAPSSCQTQAQASDDPSAQVHHPTSATISHQCRSKSASQQGPVSTPHLHQSAAGAVTIRSHPINFPVTILHPCVTKTFTFVIISATVWSQFTASTVAISQGSRSACASPNSHVHKIALVSQSTFQGPSRSASSESM
jgi:hypothetical protein